MAIEEKTPDGAEHKSDDKSQQQSDKPKVYEESYVKELIADRDKAKEKARNIEAKIAEDEQKRQSDALKAKNDYEGLARLEQEKTAKVVQAAESRIKTSYLTTLALKHGMNDTADIGLFDGKVELNESYEINNADAIEKAFEDFKKKKVYLFKSTDGKPVPRTDNTLTTKIDLNSELDKLSLQEKAEIAAKKMIEDYRARTKS